MNPKVFISYCWSSPEHQLQIIKWAERLLSDGVDVVLDVWNLKEGQDKNSFMEQMITNKTVTHVLIFSDSNYSKKADAREAGVGTESQIISEEVFNNVQQLKFVPIVCEFDEERKACLPLFLRARIWIDFSSFEAVNQNWEKLIRHLFGKPVYEKPILGNPPLYITENVPAPVGHAQAKFENFKQAVHEGKQGWKRFRQEFLEYCFEHADALRIREKPHTENMSVRVLEDCSKLAMVRDYIVDWVLLESSANPSEDFCDSLLAVLERLLELRAKPQEIHAWNDTWFEAHRVFAYETFLYIVAALLKTNSYGVLHLLFTNDYLLPETEWHESSRFSDYSAFLCSSDMLQTVLATNGRKLYSPVAEIIKRQANRKDIPFQEVIQADLITLMMAFISDNVFWYPQTLHYVARLKPTPFFLRAAQHRNFQKLAQITGIESADKLRSLVKAGHERLGVSQWQDFRAGDRAFWINMNMDSLDTVK